MSNDTVIRAPVDTAGQTDEFEVTDETGPILVYVYPYSSLTAAEYADLQREDPAGTWQDVYDHAFKGSGGQVRLDTTVSEIIVTAPGTYRLDFDDPTSAVGAAIATMSQVR